MRALIVHAGLQRRVVCSGSRRHAAKPRSPPSCTLSDVTAQPPATARNRPQPPAVASQVAQLKLLSSAERAARQQLEKERAVEAERRAHLEAQLETMKLHNEALQAQLRVTPTWMSAPLPVTSPPPQPAPRGSQLGGPEAWPEEGRSADDRSTAKAVAAAQSRQAAVQTGKAAPQNGKVAPRSPERDERSANAERAERPAERSGRSAREEHSERGDNGLQEQGERPAPGERGARAGRGGRGLEAPPPAASGAAVPKACSSKAFSKGAPSSALSTVSITPSAAPPGPPIFVPPIMVPPSPIVPRLGAPASAGGSGGEFTASARSSSGQLTDRSETGAGARRKVRKSPRQSPRRGLSPRGSRGASPTTTPRGGGSSPRKGRGESCRAADVTDVTDVTVT